MSQPSRVCPVCERGTLSTEKYTEQIQHNGKSFPVEDLERCRCDTCGADPVLTDQIRRNQVRICDAKRQADGYFTGHEIRCLRERLGLSQPDAALLFGGGPNAFSKYERGEVVQSLPMDRLLRCAAAFPMLVDYLRVLAGIDVTSRETNAYVEFHGLSLNDPWYTSRPVRGRKVVVFSSREETSVVSLVDPRKKAA
jgi:HTH-type transcriptional regulator/antitoxin MqsA